MNDEELLVQATGMQTVYVDGFGAFRKINGVLRCIGFTIDGGAQMNLIISLVGAEAGIADARRTLDEKGSKSIVPERLRLIH
ncbi:hypothetical protein IVB46_23805 [Bradyrhizobium sp. 61]|uniref:hypothetical protein n=1 Tax=Bradyrhizobium sp. 61 TaxID=2782679 RepID=UPI001FF81E45|nr:hypothetical protein [Bradyrhizobium sp. 61]MCK1278249.1 hypothetical protein [Bradyrhizobium sp. 61]